MTSRTADADKNSEDAVLYSSAIEQAHIGFYKYFVLVTFGLIIASVSAPGSSLLQNRNFIACTLLLDYDRQMKINIYSFIALMAGGLIIAVPSDLISRLKPLAGSSMFYGLSTLALGFCRENNCFSVLSVFRAFGSSALVTSTIVYVSEIQTPRYRGSSLCFLQIFWLIGTAITPVLSIPWRVSQFIFGALALLIGVLLAFFFTESPRLLLSLGKNEAAIKSLVKIHRRNFLRKGTEYPIKSLIDDFSPDAQNHIKLQTYVPKASQPPWYCLLIVSQIQFFFNLCYFTMSYWFDEINYRQILVFPIIQKKSVECNLGEKYLPVHLGMNNKNESNFFCNSVDIDADYYKEVLIVVFGTLPILIWMILRIDQFDRSYFTTLSHVFAGILSFLVHFLIGTKYYLLYTCLMEIMWLVNTTVSYCLVTEIFRTRIRVLGVALANCFGYIGMVMGFYGVLINGDGSCVFVISFTGILLTAAGLLTLSLPDVVGINLK